MVIRGGHTVTFHRLAVDGGSGSIEEPINLTAHSFRVDGRELIPQETPMDPDTTSPARPTKAALQQLTQERDDARRLLARREIERDEARHDAEAWKAVKIPDPEAEALSGCVRAIEALRHSQSSGQTSGYAAMSASYAAPTASDSPVGRILLHLAARYGITLTEPAPPAVDPDDPVILTVPRRVAEGLIESGQAYRG